MIQLVALRPNNGKLTHLFFKTEDPIPSHSYLFANQKKILAGIAKRYGSDELYNIYYTCAHHLPGIRSILAVSKIISALPGRPQSFSSLLSSAMTNW